MSKDIWNVELLKSGPDTYTIVFLMYNNTKQVIIKKDNSLYDLCDSLHKKDITYWELESEENVLPKEIENIEKMLLEKNNKE